MNISRCAFVVMTFLTAACSSDWPSFRPQSEATADSVPKLDENQSDPGSSKPKSKSKSRTSSKASEGEISPTATVDVVPAAMTDSIGPLAVEDRRFIVWFQREQHGTKYHIRRVQIRDERGAVHHEQRFDPPMRDSEPAWTTTIRAYALRGDRGNGLVLYYQNLPSAPRSGVNMRVFGLRDNRLAPIAPELTVHGRFAELQEGTEPHVLFLLPGDRIDVEVWQGYFGMVVPYRVRLSGCTSGCIREASRRGDIVPGLTIFRAIIPERVIRADTSLMLFDAPEGRSLGRIPVLRMSKVTITDAAADVFMEAHDGVNLIGSRREWLRVRIDRFEGWINGADSFTAIGLSRLP